MSVIIQHTAKSFYLTGMKGILGITSRTRVLWLYNKKSLCPYGFKGFIPFIPFIPVKMFFGFNVLFNNAELL